MICYNSSADNPSENVQIDGGTSDVSDELLRLINELLGQEPGESDFLIGWATVILAMATVISAIVSLISWFTNKKGNELSDRKPRVRDFPIGWATIILAISTIFAAWIG